jgi:TolB-like protein/DNA-binding winged helix-turn-helix (wHTH) protein/tetratricopeptide (TPR) repeat protein
VTSKKLRFDGWVLDPESGDLDRAGTRVRLQEQPALILRELITHAGSVVTREHLIALLWPKGVVDFDTGLNTAIRKLRSALGDTADTPRYIETLPRRGYRFIGSVDPDPDAVAAAPIAETAALGGEAVAEAARSARQTGAPDGQASLPSPYLQRPPEEQPTPGGPTLSIASTATLSRRRLPYLALIAALGVVALLIGVYAAWRTHSAARMTAVRVEAPPPSALPAHSVAVLPFENLSAEPSDGFLATGIAESVLHRLASVKSLSVIARTSSFTFRGRDVDARDIGRRLNARYLVEGSVQRAGDRLRVTAQLLDASSGSDVWSLRLERHMGDIFELQDEISGKVTDAIGVSLVAEPGKTSPQGTPKLDAYLAYIEGRSLLSTFKIADAEVGIERFRRAMTIDPSFAAAYAEEAHALRVLWWLKHPNDNDPSDPETERQAVALVDKALSLDPELGEAWVERAFGRQQDNLAFDATTDAYFRKGLALAPNYAQGYELYGEWLYNIRRTDDAFPMIDRARQLDPLAPRNHYFKGLMLWDSGDTDGAAALFLEALRVNPTYHPALQRLGAIEASRGNFAEAVKFMERAMALDPKAEWMHGWAGMVYLDLGDTGAAQELLAGMPPTAEAQLCLLGTLGEAKRGAERLYALPPRDLKAKVLGDNNECATDVIRYDALERRDYGRALRTLEVCPTEEWDGVLSRADGGSRAICSIRYAGLLMATGERDRATKLLHSLLTAMDRLKAYTSGSDAGTRGLVLALLGDKEGALTALEVAYAQAKWGWSYDIDHAPELQGLRAEPRFQSLARQIKDNAARQTTLLAAMRRAGEVPYRPASKSATANN